MQDVIQDIAITIMRASIKRGELARLLGCNAETVRYYENIGLIGPAERTASGHRIYHQGDVDRLRFVLRLRQLGFSLEEVRSLLETVDTGKYTCKEIAQITERHIQTIHAKIKDLTRLERSLTEITSQCHRGNTPDCAVIDALTDA